MASADGSGEPDQRAGSRQHVVKVPGARRAKLTAAPGATEAPAPRDEASDAPIPPDPRTGGPNDDRLRQDVPPHY